MGGAACLLLRGRVAHDALSRACEPADSRPRLRQRPPARRAASLVRRRRRLQPGQDRPSKERASGPDLRLRRCREPEKRARARQAVRRDRDVGHHRLARRLPRHVPAPASFLQARDALDRVVLHAAVGPADAALWQARGRPPYRSPQLALQPGHRQSAATCRFRRDQTRMADTHAVPPVRTRPSDQPVRRHPTADPQTVPPQLCNRPAATKTPRRAIVGIGRDPLPQRARQHRTGRAAHAAVRLKHRSDFRRGPQRRRHLGRSAASQGRPIRNSTSRRSSRPARARATPSARASPRRAAIC